MAAAIEAIHSKGNSAFIDKKELFKAIEAVFYDSSNIDELPWEQFQEGVEAKKLLLPLVKEGSSLFFTNVQTRVYIVTAGTLLLPITVNETEYLNSYVASNYYVVAMLDEWLIKHYKSLYKLFKPLTACLGSILKGVKANKFVLLNNWLFPNNIPPQGNILEIQAALQLLRNYFPDHLFMWRNLETFHGTSLAENLSKLKFRILKTRAIFFYDPSQKENFSSKVHYHHRRDLKLIEKNGYEIITSKDIKESDLPRLLELYQKVYMEKHTTYSPGYTLEFLKRALKEDFIDFVGLRKEGMIDGIIGMFRRGNVMISPFFGYDTSTPPSLGLYRMLTVMLLKETEKKNVVLNDSSGGAATKKYRGLKSYLEYVAIYDQHLPLGRKLYWGAMEKLVNFVVYPIIKKLDQKNLST